MSRTRPEAPQPEADTPPWVTPFSDLGNTVFLTLGNTVFVTPG